MKNIIIICLLSLTLISCAEKITTEQYLQSGQEYIDQKKWKAAIIEFKNAIKQSPNNSQARFLLGKTYLQTFSFNAAIIELNKARDLGLTNGELLLVLGKAYAQAQQDDNILSEITPQKDFTNNINADIHALRALSLFRKKDMKAGLAALEKARELDESSADVRLAWAKYEASRNDSAAQIKWLTPLLNKSPIVADAWSQMGQIHQRKGEIKEAETAYSKAIDARGMIHTDYAQRSMIRISLKDYDGAISDVDFLKKAGLNWPVIGHVKGLGEFANKNYEKAQDYLTEVNSKFPDYQPTQFILGLTHYYRGNYQNAVSLLEQYTSTNASSYDANMILASSALKLGQSNKVIGQLKKMYKDHPEDTRVLSLLGEAYVSSGDYDNGITIFEKLVKQNPNEASSRLQLGRAKLRQQPDSKTGLAEVAKALDLNPDLLQADLLLYNSYMRSRNFQKGSEIAQNIMDKHEKKSVGNNLLAVTYLAENKQDKALSFLNSTLEKFPNDLLTQDNLAKIYLRNNNLVKAKSLYVNILNQSSKNIDIHNKLALIALIEKDQEAAITWLQKSVDLNPDELSPKIILAYQYLKLNQGQKAVNVLQNASEEDMRTQNFKLFMSKAKIAAGEPDHALRILKTLISEKPSLAAAHFTISQAYASKNDSGNLRLSLQKTIDLNSEFLSAHIALARLDLFEKKVDSFKKRISVLVKNHPENKEIQFLNSKVVSGDQNYDLAIKTLSGLMTGSSNNPEIVIDLAANQWLSGNKNAAISSLELWLEGNESDNRVLMLLAQYLTEDNRIEEARQAYQKLEETIPDNPVVLNNLAWILKTSDPIKGAEYAQKALSLDKNNPYIKDTLSTLLLINNEAEKALIYSAEAANALPTQIDVQLNYSRVLVANNQKSKAKKLLNKLLSTTKSAESKKQINNELSRL